MGSFKNIVVAGGGVLGSQIAFQSAYCGFNVTIWLRSEGSISRTQPKLDNLKKAYLNAIEAMAGPDSQAAWCRGIADKDSFNREDCIARVEKAYSSIKIELDLKKAVEDADLVIEAVAENEAEKVEFYKKLAACLPEKTVIVTNSSTFLPSTFAQYTGRPEKYLSLHFANTIWRNNTAEIMPHPGTDERYFNQIMEFAEEIRMIPLPVRKEKAGYLLNSLLVPFLSCAMDLVANGISDPESIDKAWTIGTGAPVGPFQILDIVGLKTAYNIAEQYRKVPAFLKPILKKMLLPYNYEGQVQMLKKYIDAGKLGVSTGEGFYKYK